VTLAGKVEFNAPKSSNVRTYGFKNLCLKGEGKLPKVLDCKIYLHLNSQRGEPIAESLLGQGKVRMIFFGPFTLTGGPKGPPSQSAYL
jgi:hypothetical protein